MRYLFRIAFGLMLALPWSGKAHAADATATVFVIPIREEIDTPLTYLVRRGVKAAMDAKADLLVLDMKPMAAESIRPKRSSKASTSSRVRP